MRLTGLSKKFNAGLLVLLAIAQTTSCVPTLPIRVTEGDPPSFTVPCRLTAFFQTGVARLRVSTAIAPAGEGGILWEIHAVGGRRRIERVRYGEVPPGFVQVLPLDGQPPQPLRPGRLYDVEVSGLARGHAEFDHRGERVTASEISRLLESISALPTPTSGPLPPEKLRPH